MMRRLATSIPRLAVALLLLPIFAYRRLISPLLPRRCRYHPTCSAYAVEALRVHGPLRGAAMATWRIMRCNPWSHGGHDPVPCSADHIRPRPDGLGSAR